MSIASTEYAYAGALPLLMVAGLVALRVGQKEKRKAVRDAVVVLFPVIAIVSLLIQAFRLDRTQEEHFDVHWYVAVVASAQTIACLIVAYTGVWQALNLALMAVVPIALLASYCWGRDRDAIRMKCAHGVFLLSMVCTSFTLSIAGEEMHRLAFLVAIAFAAMVGYVIGIGQRNDGINVTSSEV